VRRVSNRGAVWITAWPPVRGRSVQRRITHFQIRGQTGGVEGRKVWCSPSISQPIGIDVVSVGVYVEGRMRRIQQTIGVGVWVESAEVMTQRVERRLRLGLLLIIHSLSSKVRTLHRIVYEKLTV
jgi:hypothetical protein